MSRNAVDYEKDFYAWTVEQARLLRSGELSAVDIENIAEEIESIGRSDRREIKKELLSEFPSLRPTVSGILPRAYAEAREDAADEAGLAEAAFPEACPFSAEQVLSREFLPQP